MFLTSQSRDISKWRTRHVTSLPAGRKNNRGQRSSKTIEVKSQAVGTCSDMPGGTCQIMPEKSKSKVKGHQLKILWCP